MHLVVAKANGKFFIDCRNIQEVSVQLENLSSRCLEVEDLFSPELQAKRLVIKDCCEHLFQLSPKSYGAVAREKLWRLALYDAIHKARKIQRVIRIRTYSISILDVYF